MGVPVYWLARTLPFVSICDGRYFIERIAASVGASALRTAKRRPTKAPDFVALDANGDWHVIECKGTQSGPDYQVRQLGVGGNSPSGAIAQKKTITFPVGYTGQRLACGLSIGVEGGHNSTYLKIIDPIDETRLDLREGDMIHAEDAAFRSVVAKSLRMAGFEATSLWVAAPTGSEPSSRPTRGRAEERRRTLVEEKRARARRELAAGQAREQFIDGDNRYLSREVILDLPTSIATDGREVRRVRIRQGVNKRILDALAADRVADEMSPEASVFWREYVGPLWVTICILCVNRQRHRTVTPSSLSTASLSLLPDHFARTKPRLVASASAPPK